MAGGAKKIAQGEVEGGLGREKGLHTQTRARARTHTHTHTHTHGGSDVKGEEGGGRGDRKGALIERGAVTLDTKTMRSDT